MSEGIEHDLRVEYQERAERLDAQNKRLQATIHALTDIDIERRWQALIVEYVGMRDSLRALAGLLLRENMLTTDQQLERVKKVLERYIQHEVTLE